MSDQGSGGNVLAAICNIFIPGLGQLVQGRILAAILFFVFTTAAWATAIILIGWVLGPVMHLWAIIDAARFKSSS
ncbi:hypothetical protein WNY51_14845 [Pseudocolwellia sp. AS88]|jgi:TM2 domain-containing membrane protein YozV|uniref:hypothetical protein n=1 Tax=Pseudocolwellia TaxID=2848177 RepID=UPI0026EC78CB|nr:hypothetical protein [Pseudocolwellia sp. AS88]MDO7083549.1 hypothetical protein [Pseudocolwellia sp. AS88]